MPWFLRRLSGRKCITILLSCFELHLTGTLSWLLRCGLKTLVWVPDPQVWYPDYKNMASSHRISGNLDSVHLGPYMSDVTIVSRMAAEKCLRSYTMGCCWRSISHPKSHKSPDVRHPPESQQPTLQKVCITLSSYTEPLMYYIFWPDIRQKCGVTVSQAAGGVCRTTPVIRAFTASYAKGTQWTIHAFVLF